MSAPAAYEIEDIMTALAGVFDGLTTGDQLSTQVQSISCTPDVPPEINVPAVVLELDDLDWDLNMGAGADGFTVLVTVLVKTQDSGTAQRELWRFMSRKATAGVARMKAALEANKTLSGLVSYAIFTRVRNPSTTVTVNNVDYLAAELIIEIVS
jgi:hypothetical protein